MYSTLHIVRLSYLFREYYYRKKNKLSFIYKPIKDCIFLQKQTSLTS